MNVVLIHIGNEVPPYFWQCAEQVRRWFGGNIHVVIPDRYSTMNVIRRIGLHPYPVERAIESKIYREFEKWCYLSGFWNVTLGRLFVLQELMAVKSLKDVVHIENDVLIYTNPDNYITQFRRLGNENVLLTPVGPEHASAAYMYCKNITMLNKLNSMFANYFIMGKSYIREMFGKTNINEMEMLAHFEKNYRVIKYLPIVPIGNGSSTYNLFKSVFDGASAGQFIGGTQSDPPGWAGPHHWLGAELIKNRYAFVWDVENHKRVPFMILKTNPQHRIRVNNLHIHSKNLKSYM